MAETSRDEYITLTASSNGVNASCSILTNGSNIVAYLNNVEFWDTVVNFAVLSESYWDYAEEERPKITYDSGPSFFESDPNIVEGREYNITVSYNVYVDGVCVGFDRLLGVGVIAGEKYPEPDIGELTNPPQITQIWHDHFPPAGIFVNFTLDTSNCAESYALRLSIEDTEHNQLFSCSDEEINKHDDIYSVWVNMDEITYGTIYIYVQARTSSGESCFEGVSVFLSFGFFDMYSNTNSNAVFSATEWNEYRRGLSQKLKKQGYEYNYLLSYTGDPVTPDTFNEPINAYYNAFGFYYGTLKPITGFHFGDYSNDTSKISVRKFLQELESMLNSL